MPTLNKPKVSVEIKNGQAIKLLLLVFLLQKTLIVSAVQAVILLQFCIVFINSFFTFIEFAEIATKKYSQK